MRFTSHFAHVLLLSLLLFHPGSALPAAAATGDSPLNLRSVFNRGFRSEPDNPALPVGWTNDGPGNDLRLMEPGKREFSGILFDVADPARNRGKSVLAIAGLAPRGAMEATVQVNRKIGTTLYLLHAASWIGDTSRIVGRFLINYADGNVEGYDVNKNIDVGDWWDPVDRENARCVWTARNPSASIGIFVSGFPIENKPIRSITFQTQSNVGWLILGATGSMVPVKKIGPPEKCVLKADDEWSEIAYPDPLTKAGTALDFSFLLDAPAGKYGRLVVRDGHFEFTDRPGQRVRFYGTNLCETTAFLPHELSVRQATELAAIGFNSVRLHHYEKDLLKPDARHSLDYDPMRFDQLDYQLAELKKRGIYVTLDAFCSREPIPGEIPGIEKLGPLNFHNYKQLFPIVPAALDNLKEHIRILLTHRNPYTGLTWGEDPMFTTLSLVNENEIFGAAQIHKGILQLYKDAFEETCDVQQLEPLERSRRFAQFLAEKQRAMIAELTRFIREELKSDILITDNNAQYSMLHNLIGERLAFVDSHIYFDHPWFPEVAWRLPEQLSNVSAVERFSPAPREIFANRIAGKPFTVTEFNFCFPNSFRAESGPMMGGYSAFQDYDAIYRFDYIHNRGRYPELGIVGGLSSGNDPACYFADKIGILLFLRGDVRPGEKLYTLLYGENFLREFEKPLHMTTTREWNTTGRIPEGFTRLGLLHRVASLNYEQYPAFREKISEAFAYHNIPLEGVRSWSESLEEEFRVREKEDRVYRSDTGELELDAANVVFKVNTPRSAALCMAVTAEAESGALSVRAEKPGQRTVAACALGDEPLRTADSILVFHLTTVYNTGIVFGDKTMRRLESIGNLPMLVRNDRAEIALALEQPESFAVAALHYDGTIREELPVRIENGKLIFTADSGAGAGSFVYWVRKK